MQRLKISDNGRYLATEDGQPFFWMADTAWELFHRCTVDEITRYLDNRRDKGFNVIQAVALAELDGLRVPNRAGELPFRNFGPGQPNPAYFDFIETVIQMAAERDLYICLLPTWGDKINLAWGVGPQIFNPENARAYGRYIGDRFREHDNLIWMNGGDRRPVENGVDYRPVFRALGEGVRAEAAQLMTYHPVGTQGSSMEFHRDDWLDFNTWQSGHIDVEVPVWKQIAGDWLREPIKPVLDSEPCYEHIPVQFKPENGFFTPYDIRRRVYRGVFAGGCGFTYGHNCIWQMYDDEREPQLGADTPWHQCLDDPAAFQMHHLKDLMLSRPYFSRIPDQSLLLSEEGEHTRHVRATRDIDGSYALIYIPTWSQAVQIDLHRLDGERFQASWFNPRNGETTALGEVGRQDNPTFTATERGPDWVLVLDRIET